MHQRLRHELAAIGPEVAARIRHLIRMLLLDFAHCDSLFDDSTIRKVTASAAMRISLHINPAIHRGDTNGLEAPNGFNRFPSRDKETVKTVSNSPAAWITAMNREVNVRA